jgi:hypothetical protein
MAAPPPFGATVDDRTEQSPLDAIRQQTSKIEDLLDTISEPIRPCVPLAPPFSGREVPQDRTTNG